MFTLIENGELFAPEPLGRQSLLMAGGRIVRIGKVDREKLEALELPTHVVDASSCVVTPGFIDPHEHLIGAAGEQGFVSRTPEVPLHALVAAGITTVVGCLGTDTTCRSLTTLLARTRQLEAEGLTAFMYTGGFPVPPPTITASIRDDLVLIDKVIGVGEIAISDRRSSQPSLDVLARLVSEAYVGGLVGGKAGVTHFHTGPGRELLAPLHALLDRYEVSPEQLYATHVQRSEALMDDAVALTRRGAYVDIDTIDEDLGPWLRYFREKGGDWERVTASSDAYTIDGLPRKLHGQLVSSVLEHGFLLEEVLPCFTRNVATVLKLEHKGRLREGADADVLVLSRERLELEHVFARGRWMVRDGKVIVQGRYEGMGG